MIAMFQRAGAALSAAPFFLHDAGPPAAAAYASRQSLQPVS